MNTYVITVRMNGGQISGDVWVDFAGSELTYETVDPCSATGAPVSVGEILRSVATDIAANEWRPKGKPVS